MTKTYSGVLLRGLTALDPRLPENISQRSGLATAWRQFERVLDNFLANGLLAA
jgi:hypothetical protein